MSERALKLHYVLLSAAFIFVLLNEPRLDRFPEVVHGLTDLIRSIHDETPTATDKETCPIESLRYRAEPAEDPAPRP